MNETNFWDALGILAAAVVIVFGMLSFVALAAMMG